MSLGGIIKRLRKQSGLTLKELGERVGVSDSAICQIERSRTKNPRLALVARILYELKCPPSYAFKEAGLPAYSDNPGTCFPPMIEVCEIINMIPEGPKKERLESLLLQTARTLGDHTE